MGSFNSVGGGGSDDMFFNSLVIMVGVWCLPFLQMLRESVVRRKVFLWGLRFRIWGNNIFISHTKCF